MVFQIFVTFFVKWKLDTGHHFEMVKFFFSDLWLFKMYTDMVQVSCQNSFEKAVLDGAMDPLVH